MCLPVVHRPLVVPPSARRWWSHPHWLHRHSKRFPDSCSLLFSRFLVSLFSSAHFFCGWKWQYKGGHYSHTFNKNLTFSLDSATNKRRGALVSVLRSRPSSGSPLDAKWNTSAHLSNTHISPPFVPKVKTTFVHIRSIRTMLTQAPEAENDHL